MCVLLISFVSSNSASNVSNLTNYNRKIFPDWSWMSVLSISFIPALNEDREHAEMSSR